MFLITSSRASAAACTAPATDYGTVTSSVSVPATANYRIWTRMSAPDSTHNTYLLQVDTTNCYNVGGSTVPVSATTNATHFVAGSSNWINVTSTGTAIDLSLTAGTHTLTMIGNAQDVIIDRVLLIQDNGDGSAGCSPTDAGDNCANPPDTTSPTVSITSPADAASVTSPLAVAVSASDDSGTVSKVELYVDGSSTPTATDTTSPFSFASVTLTPGAHTLKAKAYDPTGNAGLSTIVNVTVRDTTNPTATLTAPTNGSTVSGTISLTSTATDNVGVTQVEFYVDGTLYNTDTTTPYTTSYDTTTLTNGSHTVQAKASDAAGNIGSSSTASVTVNNVAGGTDTTAPTVDSTNPAATEAIYGKPYTVTGTASDASGLQKITFQIDSGTVQTDTTAPYTYSLDTTTLTNGTHTLKVLAYDNSTNHNVSTLKSVSFRVTVRQDVTRDCRVNFSDIGSILPRLGTVGSNLGAQELNDDGKINFSDIGAVLPQLGTTPC